MRIIIIGDGKVGHSIAEALITEGHEVTIVDRSETALLRSRDTLDAMMVKGNGVNVDTLMEAGAPMADIVIAVTVSDEINMLSCLSNIGPGPGVVGPAGNYGVFSPAVKMFLSFLMLAGRLEFIPLLALFHRELWGKGH